MSVLAKWYFINIQLNGFCKKGDVLGITNSLQKIEPLDKIIINKIITKWQNYNGSFLESLTLKSVMQSILQANPEYAPEIAEIKVLMNDYKHAGELFEMKNELQSAGFFYEKGELFEKARLIYSKLNDNEGVSRMFETLGDFENAYKFVVKPERKAHLLIKLERFAEALQFISGLNDSLNFHKLLNEGASKKIDIELSNNNFVEGIKLCDYVSNKSFRKAEILSKGRLFFNDKLKTAKNQDDIINIYSERLLFEEFAGEFEEAAKIAEEILGDLDKASFLYQKANLINRAIETLNINKDNKDKYTEKQRRLAELHEEGGNLIKSAELYKSIGDYKKAYTLYKNLMDYNSALFCYYQTQDKNDDELVELYILAEKYDEAINVLLTDKSINNFQKALDIATQNELLVQERKIQALIAELTTGNKSDLEKYYNFARSKVINSYSPILGIDFGTSNSVGAIFNKKTQKVEHVPIPGKLDNYYEPSIFGLSENGEHIFGEKAEILQLTKPENAISHIKRKLTVDGNFNINGKKFKAQEIAGLIMNKIKNNAVTFLNEQVKNQTINSMKENSVIVQDSLISDFFLEKGNVMEFRDVVLSVPAGFDDSQKRATYDAAEIAGLNVKRLIAEPSAAGLYYDFNTNKKIEGKVLVVDLGGGTLDLSIMEVGEGVYEVLSVGGDTNLGGKDIDDLIYNHFVNEIQVIHGKSIKRNHLDGKRLLESCEKLKIRLSDSITETIEIYHLANLPSIKINLTRDKLEEIAKPIIDRYSNCIDSLLKESNVKIDYYLFIGNATYMPLIKSKTKEIVKNSSELKGTLPGTAVASGAACLAAVLSGDIKEKLLLDVIPHSLGIELEGEKFEILIDKNTTIPTKKNKEFTTTKDNQSKVDIFVYQGESSIAKVNKLIGYFCLEGIPPATKGIPKIDVGFDIDVNGILRVSATDDKTKNSKSIVIKGTTLLTPEEKNSMKTKIANENTILSINEKIKTTKEEYSKNLNILLNAIDKAISSYNEFLELFREKIEINATQYNPNDEQLKTIQSIFIEKETIYSNIFSFRDNSNEFKSKLQNIEIHLDYTNENILDQLNERLKNLQVENDSISKSLKKLKLEITEKLFIWVNSLKSLKPDESNLTKLELVNSLIVNKEFNRAKAILEEEISKKEKIDLPHFNLLTTCLKKMKLADDYFNLHKKSGVELGLNYPNYDNLSLFLKGTEDKIFMIYSKLGSGTGFSIAKNKIVTNKHVIEGVEKEDLKIKDNKEQIYSVDFIEFDDFEDIVILNIKGNLPFFNIGEFDFVSPGESVLAVGFPRPESTVYSDNIYISKGIVNSIRQTPESHERVVFFDAKIGPGSSGGPLINSLGEVIGITTLYYSELVVGGQPVALPIHLINKYIN